MILLDVIDTTWSDVMFCDTYHVILWYDNNMIGYAMILYDIIWLDMVDIIWSDMI